MTPYFLRAGCAAAVIAAAASSLQLLVAGMAQSGAHSGCNGARRAVVAHASSQITIDGVLDEPDWAAATPIGEILQREPRPGEKASERTEVKLLYDRENLYLGVMCYDSEP